MELEKLQVKLKEIQVICAYKQGFSWIEEVVLPQLEGKRIQKVEIALNHFFQKVKKNGWMKMVQLPPIII